MKLEGKTVIITSNSSVFLKLTKLFIENSGKSRSNFFVVAENGLPFKDRFRKRIEKIGILTAVDEWLYTRYEALFNHWAKAESKLLKDIEITSFSPDILTDTVNKSSVSILDSLNKFEAENIISIGSGYIPSRLLEQFDVKINIHPGILPNYKGIGSPEAIMRGDHFSLGWSLHELAPKIDSGSIIHNHIISYKDIENMTFADIYITIYKLAIIDFYSVLNNSNKNEINFKSDAKYFAFVSFTQFIKYKFKPAHNSV
jgi:methionyl-tRNA formyltransferase